MKSLFILLTCVMTLNAFSQCPKDGASVMKAQEKAQYVNFEYEALQLTLLDVKSGVKEARTLKRHIKGVNQSQKKSLIAFLAPADIKGTALLNWEQSDREDDQWLYTPALRKTTRIAGGSKKNYFMGTDFTYADFESENIQDYNYTCKQMKKCGKKKCYEIEALPKSRKIQHKTGYSKRILLIAENNLTTIRVKYFDPKGNLLKTLTNVKWKKYTDTAWRPGKMTMDRHNFHKTTMVVEDRKIGQAIDDVVFTERYILKNMHTK